MDIKGRNVLVLMGDKRQEYLVEYLIAEDCNAIYESSVPSEEIGSLISKSDFVIAPIPFGLMNHNEERISKFTNMSILLGGCIPSKVKEYCSEKGIICYDFMEDEELAAYNAIATTEGAIAEAISNHPTNLRASKCLVLGYGKCGKELAITLHHIGAKVTVGARKYDVLEEVMMQGLESIDLNHDNRYKNELSSKIGTYDYIFNTIPSVIMDRDLLQKVSKDSTIIDIASKPGGVDYEVVKELQINAKLSLGLPGKYSPKSSAKGILECIKRI